MNLEKAIRLAQILAQSDYIISMIKMNCHNPDYERKWEEHKLDDGRIGYGLSGTPDKAFVVVSADKKLVTALTQAGKKLKTFKVCEELGDKTPISFF